MLFLLLLLLSLLLLLFLLLLLTLLPLPLLSRFSRVRRLVCLCLGLLRALGIQVKFLHFIVDSHSLPSRHYLPASAFSSSSYFVFVLTLTGHSRGLHGINATDPCRHTILVISLSQSADVSLDLHFLEPTIDSGLKQLELALRFPPGPHKL